MNPMFWVLLIALCIVLWFLIAPIFQFIGGHVLKIYNKAKNELTARPQENKESEIKE